MHSVIMEHKSISARSSLPIQIQCPV